MTFRDDLKKQEPNVEAVTSHVWGTKIEGRYKAGDVLLEVKEDMMCKKTGNVAMEVEYNWEPSGIYAWSEIIVYKLWKNFWKAKTEDVKYHLVNNPEYRVLFGGDGRKSKLILVPYWDFTQMFTFLFSE